MTVRLLWQGSGWAEEGAPVPAPAGALVVDSFLLENGTVRDLDVHLDRFTRSCLALRLVSDTARLREFLALARDSLPVLGRWFPRIEAHPAPRTPGTAPRLVLWVREAPPVSEQVRLWVPPEPDPRGTPGIKGPDLAVLAGLRDHARRQGADDAILLADDGTVLEAAHSALVWWRGDVLCHPHHELPLLPSVTARRVLELARDRGIALRPEHCPWPRLLDAEVWTLNALHGVRPVVGWSHAGREVDGSSLDRSPLDRSPLDRARLADFRWLLSGRTSGSSEAAQTPAVRH
ncbi:MAG TPA: aminotransferase class IV [Pseudonocardia sp.]